MRRYLQNRWFQAGLVVAVLGCGPLIAIIALDAVGTGRDSNPVGPGMLFLVAGWPAIICLVLGALQVRRRADPDHPVGAVGWQHHPATRILAGMTAAILLIRGGFDLLVLKVTDRGPASALVVGAGLAWWAIFNRRRRVCDSSSADMSGRGEAQWLSTPFHAPT